MGFVQIEHPDIGAQARVSEAALPFLEPKGWQRVPDVPVEFTEVEALEDARLAELPVPSATARKAEWVAYAVAHGMAEADAEALTIQELTELYTSTEGV